MERIVFAVHFFKERTETIRKAKCAIRCYARKKEIEILGSALFNLIECEGEAIKISEAAVFRRFFDVWNNEKNI